MIIGWTVYITRNVRYQTLSMVPTDVELVHAPVSSSLKSLKAGYEYENYKFVVTESARDM